ncbi:MAG TPA: phenylalanine--tRNA ligase subunit beta [Sediminispirochaeta sp.]|mgnify:CR=1 FL=1|nr:phenylalanine--tRNA ligase subunit beta [Sediminispirochaeta sp.]
MPKIEVFQDALYKYAGKKYGDHELEEMLTVAKGELDDKDESSSELKIELNDTNRPDLWSTAGVGRQLRVYKTGEVPQYDFFSTADKEQDYGDRVVKIDPSVKDVRPYEVALAARGRAIDEATLKDIIQTQEKLCWNFGRKRRSIAIGVFRSDLLTYPITYRAADPDETKFVPLQMEEKLSLRQMTTEHPKGREYGHIVADFSTYPYLEDAKGEALSFPPVINSAYTGAVKVGDENIFIEMTGTELRDLILTANIVACDLADAGFEILPVKIVYPYETEFGGEIVSPFYFQQPVELELDRARKMLGVDFSPAQAKEALQKMGVRAEGEEKITVTVPPYRNDFLHEVDIIEDIMIGHGMDRFEPIMPSDFTPGRLTAEEEFARKVRDIMIGMGFQEMMYNYLGSKRDFIDKMELSGEEFIQIENPMTENYEFVRASIMPNLLHSESVSAHAVYPHHIFEIGKIAYLHDADNSGTVTRNSLGFLSSDGEVGFNEVSAHVSAIFYYLSRDYRLEELDDPRFIPGRAARILYRDQSAGMFGEVHPRVLENWGVQMPCTCCEIDLDTISLEE